MILIDPDLEPPPAASRKRAATPPESRKSEPEDRLPSVRTLHAFLREAQAVVRLKGAVSVLLTTDRKIKTLNRDFRGKNKATDVLSFPAAEVSRGEVAGDLAISVDTARRQGREQGHGLRAEIKVLMLHGLLHLAGYDHETDQGEMAKRERALRGRLRLPVGLIERAGVHGGAGRKATADPSTARPAKNAGRSARDDKVIGKRGSSQDDKVVLKRRSVLDDKASVKRGRVRGGRA